MYLTFTYAADPVLSRRVKSTLSAVAGRRFGDDAEAPQIDQHAGFQQLLGGHRQLAAAGIGAAEQRGDAMRERPDVEAHHQRPRPLVLRHAGAPRLLPAPPAPRRPI